MSQIINDGSNLLLTLENGEETRVAKEDVELKKYDDGIFINDGLQSYKFIHANVTDPVTGTPDLLFDAVDAMLEDLVRKVSFETSDSSATTQLAASATNITLLSANADRKGATFFYDGTDQLSLKLGATATLADFTFRFDNEDYYEVPFGYTGIIDGIWNGTNGTVTITELT